MIAWLARRRQRREAARWARIEAHAAALAGPLGQDAARRRGSSLDYLDSTLKSPRLRAVLEEARLRQIGPASGLNLPPGTPLEAQTFQVGPHPLSGEAVGGSGAAAVSQERPALHPVLARPTPVPDGRVSAEGWQREGRAP